MFYHQLLISLLLLFTLLTTVSVGQLSYVHDGQLDRTFGQNGFAFTNWSFYANGTANVTIEPDGTVFWVTSSFFSIISPIRISKQLSNGSIDTSFAEGGFKTIAIANLSLYGTATAVQPDGKLLVGGYTGWAGGNDFIVFRMLPNGDLDVQFGNGGYVIIDVPPRRIERQTADRLGSINILKDGKILISGTSEEIYDSPSRFDIFSVLCRLNSDGSLDNAFGDLGMTKTQISSGYSPGVLPPPVIAKIMPDGRIIASAYTEVRPIHNSPPIYSHRFFLQYQADGSLNPAFGQGGMTEASLPSPNSSFTVASDGKILYSGFSNLGRLFRLNADGSPDKTFGNNGEVIVGWHGIWSIAIASDQKILLGGYFDIGNYMLVGKLARFWSDGTRDIRFGQAGVVTVDGNGNRINIGDIRIFQEKYLLVAGYKYTTQPDAFLSKYIIRRKF